MSKPKLPIEMVEGDTLPQLIIQCTQVLNGVKTPQNITGYTFTLTVARPSPASVLVKTGTIVDAANGKVVFTWASGDWKMGLAQKAFLTTVDAGGYQRSFGEFTFNVSKRPS